MKNNTFEEIAEVLNGGKKILIFPHTNMDGDAMGSAAALCAGLRQKGKECYVLIEDGIPDNLEFLDKDYCTMDQNVLKKHDISICVDCGDDSRFAKRKDKFREAKTTVCVDHHATSEASCDYNYIDSATAATGELIYLLLQALEVKIDKEIGEAIFTAITTDTGNFQYSNTTARTHEIVAALYDAGIDSNGVSIKLYESARMERILIKNKALSVMSTVAGGKGVIAYVTQEMLEETGALMNETDGIVAELRSIGDVEVSVLLKESEENKIKVSMRSKSYVNVADIAAEFGGGGHMRAAGFTLHCSLAEAFDAVKEKITDSLEKI